MLDRFRRAHAPLHDVAATDAEHEAALELMLLVVVADGEVAVEELDAIEQMVEGGGWESPTFNYLGRFGPAMAAVRAVEPAQRESYVPLVAQRITTPELRRRVIEACREVSMVDLHQTTGEREVLGQIEQALR